MSSILTVRQKSTERLKIQESDLLESIQNIRNRIYKSDIQTSNKDHLDKTIKMLEDSLRDYFALEMFYATRSVETTKKVIGNN